MFSKDVEICELIGKSIGYGCMISATDSPNYSFSLVNISGAYTIFY